MDPQLRRTEVTFQVATETRDPISNESQQAWSDLRTVMGQIKGRFGNERHRAGSQESAVTHTIRVDFYDLDGITEAHRVVVEDRVMVIKAIIRDYEGHGESMVDVIETDTPVDG